MLTVATCIGDIITAGSSLKRETKNISVGSSRSSLKATIGEHCRTVPGENSTGSEDRAM